MSEEPYSSANSINYEWKIGPGIEVPKMKDCDTLMWLGRVIWGKEFALLNSK